MLSAFGKPRSGGFTKGSYQRAVASGFFVFHYGIRTPSVSNAPSPGGVEEKGCRFSDDPDGVAFRSDHKNEQLYRLSAAGPRHRALDNWNTAFCE